MDWIAFFESNRIGYDTRGKNVSGNHVAVTCPFCGGTDPSRHLVVNLAGAGWHCWRNPQHRGRSPVGLIAALLHCSIGQARTIAGESRPTPPDNLFETVSSMLDPEEERNGPIEMPEDFRQFSPRYSAQRFVQYLRSRYFPNPIEALTQKHDMYYAVSGEFHGRVLFTVRSPEGELMGWTGRSIYSSEECRYKSHGALGYLLWLDRLPRKGSDTLVLCEGPMDALKVSALGESVGVDATCCFTSTPTKRQVDHLYQLRPRYRHCYIMLDEGEVANTMWTADALSPLQVKPIFTYGMKDPGDLRQSSQLCRLLGEVGWQQSN